MKTKIWMQYYFGAYSICYIKYFEFPFAPFFGLRILDTVGDIEITIDLAEKRAHYNTMIDYDTEDQMFSIYIRDSWHVPMDYEYMDGIISNFIEAGWIEKSNDIEIIKELMRKKFNS